MYYILYCVLYFNIAMYFFFLFVFSVNNIALSLKTGICTGYSIVHKNRRSDITHVICSHDVKMYNVISLPGQFVSLFICGVWFLHL